MCKYCNLAARISHSNDDIPCEEFETKAKEELKKLIKQQNIQQGNLSEEKDHGRCY